MNSLVNATISPRFRQLAAVFTGYPQRSPTGAGRREGAGMPLGWGCLHPPAEGTAPARGSPMPWLLRRGPEWADLGDPALSRIERADHTDR